MKLSFKAGTTSKLVTFFVQDSSSTTGAGLTGLAYSTASLTAYYYREGAAAPVQISLATMTLGIWASGGFIVVDGTNMPGCYQLGVPDAALAAGAKSAQLMLKGAANMAPVLIEVELTAVDNQDTVRMGLTALPNAAAEAAGGLFTRGSGAGQLNQNANGQVDTRVVSNTDKTGYALTAGEHTSMATDVQTGLTAQGFTSTRGGYLDTLNGLVNAIWGNASRTLSAFGFNVTVGTNSDKTGYALTAGEHTAIASDAQTGLTAQGYTTARAGFLDTLNGVVAAFWEAAVVGFVTAGTIGKLLKDNVDAAISSRKADFVYTAPDNATIASIALQVDALDDFITASLGAPIPPASLTTMLGNLTDLVNALPQDTDVTDILNAIGDLETAIGLAETEENAALRFNYVSGAISAVQTAVGNLTPATSEEVAAVQSALESAISTSEGNLSDELSGVPAAVWSSEARTLTGFGTLLADIWGYVTRSLTDKAGFAPTVVQNRQELDSNSTQLASIKAKTDNLPASPAATSDLTGLPALIWSYGTRTLSTFGTLVADIRTAIWNATVRSLSDKAGFAPTAAQVRQEVDANSTQLAAIKTKVDNIATGSAPTAAAIRQEFDANSVKLASIKSTVEGNSSRLVTLKAVVDSTASKVTTLQASRFPNYVSNTEADVAQDRLVIPQGATLEVRYDCVDETGTPIDFRGAIGKLQVRMEQDPTADVLFERSTEDGGLTDLTDGSFTVYAAPEDTETLEWPKSTAYFDILFLVGGKTYKLVEGTATLEPGVTRL